jgi:hypothetical protein
MRCDSWLEAVAASMLLTGCSLLTNLDGFSSDFGKDAAAAEGSAHYAGLSCGDAACNPAAEVCCFPTGNGDDIAMGTCGQANCGGEDFAQCASSEDCAHTTQPGDDCCYVLVQNSQGTHYFAQCTPPGACTSGVLFCDPQAAQPCANGGSCLASSIIGGLSSCAP